MGKNDQASKHFNSINTAHFIRVPHTKGANIGSEDLNILWYIDGEVFTDGLVRGVVFPEFGSRDVEEFFVNGDFCVFDLGEEVAHVLRFSEILMNLKMRFKKHGMSNIIR